MMTGATRSCNNACRATYGCTTAIPGIRGRCHTGALPGLRTCTHFSLYTGAIAPVYCIGWVRCYHVCCVGGGIRIYTAVTAIRTTQKPNCHTAKKKYPSHKFIFIQE
jgi:hypothetical protein